ncbi:hypothetical protein [Paenibacillus sp. A14]|uniref:hypothetical protein n=1 Tax=Paenibacillus sp. A14 TaxID=3119820 RepID=UPI002FE3F98E
MEELKGDNYSHLIRISPLVKDDSLKALLIETIVESPYYTKNGSRLLEEYVQQLSKGTATVEAAARCLGAFTASVYSNNEILLQIAENVDHEFGIEILVTMGVPIGGRYQTIWGLWLCVFKKNREYDIVRG